MIINISEKSFEEAKKYIPGGVNSPARAFLAVKDTPRFIDSAKEQFIYDVDGNKYIDYIGSWGPMILGNNHPIILNAVKERIEKGLSFGAATQIEVEMAKLINKMVPTMEMMRMVTSGTEATMSALRAARGYTGREKIIKFEGCYHGHNDALLVRAGSALIADGGATPDSAGVTKGTTKDTLLALYNDFDSVQKLFEENKGEIAAVIIEPVPANMGVVIPKPGFLEDLREICTANGTVLIFDEVISGFRLSPGGAQELLGIKPDMSTFGKVIGGGMPVGCYGGKREIMECVAPLGHVFQAGTLAGNPIAMAAGIAQLTYLKNNDDVYKHINALSERLFNGIEDILNTAKKDYTINRIGSLGSLFFTDQKVVDFETAKSSDVNKFSDYFKHMLSKNNYIAPAQFEAVFMSYAHTEKDIDKTIGDAAEFFGV